MKTNEINNEVQTVTADWLLNMKASMDAFVKGIIDEATTELKESKINGIFLSDECGVAMCDKNGDNFQKDFIDSIIADLAKVNAAGYTVKSDSQWFFVVIDNRTGANVGPKDIVAKDVRVSCFNIGNFIHACKDLFDSRDEHKATIIEGVKERLHSNDDDDDSDLVEFSRDLAISRIESMLKVVDAKTEIAKVNATYKNTDVSKLMKLAKAFKEMIGDKDEQADKLAKAYAKVKKAGITIKLSATKISVTRGDCEDPKTILEGATLEVIDAIDAIIAFEKSHDEALSA